MIITSLAVLLTAISTTSNFQPYDDDYYGGSLYSLTFATAYYIDYQFTEVEDFNGEMFYLSYEDNDTIIKQPFAQTNITYNANYGGIPFTIDLLYKTDYENFFKASNFTAYAVMKCITNSSITNVYYTLPFDMGDHTTSSLSPHYRWYEYTDLDFESPYASIPLYNTSYTEYQLYFYFTFKSAFDGSDTQLYQDGYDAGLLDGQSQGYDSGYEGGYEVGVEDGQLQGYQIGYSEGYQDAENTDATTLTIFNGILSVGILPVQIFMQLLNWEVFGINIGSFVSATLSVLMLIIVFRFIFKSKVGE